MSKENIGVLYGEPWTPSDTVVIRRHTRGFQVGVAGDVTLGYSDGTSHTWPACIAGVVHPHDGFIRLLSTDTTASTISVAY
jgi:hypothetical protein